MITGAAVCPSPPLLARELTGRTLVLPDLRDACAAAVARLLAPAPGVVVVVGGAAATASWDPGARLDPFNWAPALGRRGTQGLPLSLGLGAMLLDEAGYTGRRVLRAVGETEPPAECVRLGASLTDMKETDTKERTAILVMGDGSARRSPAAPGHFDDRAEPFDRMAEQALRDGDMAALTKLDPALARDLMATGRAAWQVLAGALGERRPKGEILYASAPFGVGYLVALFDHRARSD